MLRRVTTARPPPTTPTASRKKRTLEMSRVVLRCGVSSAQQPRSGAVPDSSAASRSVARRRLGASAPPSVGDAASAMPAPLTRIASNAESCLQQRLVTRALRGSTVRIAWSTSVNLADSTIAAHATRRHRNVVANAIAADQCLATLGLPVVSQMSPVDNQPALASPDGGHRRRRDGLRHPNVSCGVRRSGSSGGSHATATIRQSRDVDRNSVSRSRRRAAPSDPEISDRDTRHPSAC